jgi:uncharacterized protein (DUF362 family)
MEDIVSGVPTWHTDNTVCLFKTDSEGLPGPEAFRLAALNLMRALWPLLGARVVIKPNVVWKMPADSGVVTHPAFVGGLVDALRERGLSADDIVVAEGGGIEGDHDMAEFFTLAGYADELSSRGVELRDLNDDGSVEMALPGGRVLHTLHVARTIVGEERTIINVAKLKTHNFAAVTLCVKNMQGMLSPIHHRHLCTRYPRYKGDDGVGVDLNLLDHPSRFFDKLMDLAQALHPDLHIIEGVVGRDGTGFQRGKNIPMGIALAGINPLAVDTVGAMLMGLDPQEVGPLHAARERELTGTDPEQIRVLIVRNGRLAECRDWQRYRADPPFTVIRRDDVTYTMD